MMYDGSRPSGLVSTLDTLSRVLSINDPNVRNAQQSPFGSLNLPKNALEKVNYYLSMQYKINISLCLVSSSTREVCYCIFPCVTVTLKCFSNSAAKSCVSCFYITGKSIVTILE